MTIRDGLLPEFDMEMEKTRNALGRIMDEKLGWKPHQKSWTLGELANHIANLPNWGTITMGQESIDLAPPEGAPPQEPPARTREEILRKFDTNVAASRVAIANADDALIMKPWTLLSGGNAMFTMPKIAVMRNFVMNHLIHHRGEFVVYLRLLDIPVPALYGPSADEGQQMAAH